MVAEALRAIADGSDYAALAESANIFLGLLGEGAR